MDEVFLISADSALGPVSAMVIGGHVLDFNTLLLEEALYTPLLSLSSR